jgi:phosphomevalonate kinase
MLQLCFSTEERRTTLLEDNLYIVTLVPDEFHELISEYENYVEWSLKSMTDEQKAMAQRVLKRLHEADTLHVCLDEQDHTTHETQVKQFTRDDVARIAASMLSSVLEKVSQQHIMQCIAVLPAGEGVYLIDVVMKDLTAESTWGVSIIIPPTEEQ